MIEALALIGAFVLARALWNTLAGLFGDRSGNSGRAATHWTDGE